MKINGGGYAMPVELSDVYLLADTINALTQL
jgi:hypothetical protein